MKHTLSLKTKAVPVRWGVVIKVVLAVCVAAFVAFAVWYVIAVAIPQQENATVQREFDELTLRNLSQRMLRVETMLHLH